MEGSESADQSGIEDIEQILEERIEYLRLVAKEIVDGYWLFRKRGNEVKKYKSNLGCRLRERENHFIVVWFCNSYSLSKGKVQTYSKHLEKGRSSKKYPESTLRKVAQSWEVDTVLLAESMFADIREELAIIATIRRKLKTHRRLAGKIQGLVEEHNLAFCERYAIEVGQDFLPSPGCEEDELESEYEFEDCLVGLVDEELDT